MIIVQENQPAKNIKTLEELVLALSKIDLALRQLERKLIVISLPESFVEGTPADREFVKKKIIELQSLISKIDDVSLLLYSEDTSAYNKKKASLLLAEGHIKSIRNTMLSIWEMRNSGSTPENDKAIEMLIKKAFENVNKSIKEVKNFVSAYNLVNQPKLKFSVKWTQLPK